jgi:hypothetical protein
MNTIPSPRPAFDFLQQQDTFARFRRALRRQDQLVLDDLFASASQHLSAAELAERALPFESMLLCMLIEQRKEIERLEGVVEGLQTTAKQPS